MFKTLTVAAIALAAVVAATPAQAGGVWFPNGVSLNGLQLNGLTLNGAKINGAKINGRSARGTELTGGMKVLAIELPARR